MASTQSVQVGANSEDTNIRYVLVGYKKEFSGTKFHADGDICEVSKEVAESMVNSGVGQLCTKEGKPLK